MHKSKIFFTLLFFILLCQFNASAQYIMPHSGDTTITISSYYTHTLRNPNWPNNTVGSNSTITFNSYDGRPFSIIGSYVMHSSDHLIFYDGPSTDYPVVGIYYNGRPDVNIYCHSGSITIKHFSSTGGTGSLFDLTIGFSSIHDVRVEGTTTETTTIKWNDFINHTNYCVDVIEYEGNTRQTYRNRTYSQRYLDYYVSGGVKYPYYIRANYSNNDTGTYDSPIHYFRTPRIQDCSHCDHNRNCIDYTALNADMSYVYSYRGTNTNPELELCNENGDFTSETARHAVHTARSRKDSRTGNQLKEVPSGDTASVRLGNWNGNHEGESIMYEIHVDTNDYNLMMLRYAVVFLKADGTEHQQPRFSIRLTDENCVPLEPLCYNRDYFANTTANGWNTRNQGTHHYVWHDWMAMAIDLSPYHGKVLYLSLTTCDGTLSGSAYAYYTLHCDRKQIAGQEQCGNNIENTLYAPAGFNYRWFKADNPDSTLSTAQSLHVVDSGLYQCMVTAVDCPDSSCGYIINALACPRYPHADFDTVISNGICNFKVRFPNRSKVVDQYGVPLWTNEECEKDPDKVFWDFGNGETSNSYDGETTYDSAGLYTVTLVSCIADCCDTMQMQLNLQWKYPTPIILGDSSLCPHDTTQIIVYNAKSFSWNYASAPDGVISGHAAADLNLRGLMVSDTAYCTAEDSNGCHYLMKYPITVHDTFNLHYNEKICQAQLDSTWTWRGHDFTSWYTTGSYQFNEYSQYGCDSAVTLHLTVHPTYNEYPVYVFCDNSTSYPYPPNWQTPLIVYDTIGPHVYVFHNNVTGCDSIIHMTLREHVVAHDTVVAEVCRDFAFDTFDFHYTASQTHTLGLHTATHTATEQIREWNQVQLCDSTMTLLLTVNPQTDTSIFVIRNESQLPYWFNGVSFSHNVTDTVFHLYNRYGCDSSIHFTFLINFNAQTHLYNTICDDALPFSWDGFTFTQAGTQTQHLHRTNGADSMVYRHLTVNPTFNNTTLDTICDDGSRLFCGTTYSSSGTYQHNLATIHNCDSVETLQLVVNPTNSNTVTETICANHPYSFAGQSLSTSNTYTHTFDNIYHCDSVVTLNLTVNPVSETTIHDTVLENDLPRIFNGNSYNSDTENSIIVLANSHGCDSTIHYYLKVQWNQTNTVERTICDDALPYNWDGTIFTANDMPQQGRTIVKTVTLADNHGADSVVTRRLTVNPTYNQNFNATICDNTSYSFAGTTYNTTGTYTHNLSSIHQCDSTVTLSLTVNAVTYSAVDTTILENDLASFVFNGLHFQGEVTNQTITITNNAGCDSNISFTLHIIPNVSTGDTHTICQSELPHIWNGVTFTNAGIQSTLLFTTNGADSIVRMVLYVNPTYFMPQTVTICDNQQTTFNNVTYNTAGTYVDTLQTIHQCDSVTQLTLIVNPTHISEFYDTTCDNHPYYFGGSVRSSEGDHTHTFDNIFGCDSVVTLHLHIDSVTHSTIYDTIVENDLPYQFLGSTFTESLLDSSNSTFNYLLTTTNVRGCDSIVNYFLTINRNQHTTVYQSICDNEFPVNWDGTMFTANDTRIADTVIVKNDTLMDISGADSVVTRRLHIFPTFNHDFNDTICNDTSYLWEGDNYTATGNYTKTLASVHQCDSVVTLHLKVNSVTYSTIVDTIVENDLPYTFLDSTFNMSAAQAQGNYITQNTIFTILNHEGCDSIITYTLLVHWNVYDTVDSTVCQSALPMQWNNAVFTGDSAVYDPQLATFNINDTLTAWTGADSILTMRLHVNPTFDKHFYDTICSNEQVTFNNSVYNLPGNYAHLLQTIHQCDSLETLHLTVFGTSAASISDTIVENTLRNTYTFNGTLFDTNLFGSETYITPRFSQLDSTITIVNRWGCDSTINYTLNVHWNVAATADSTICENFMPLQWNNVSFTGDSGTYDTQNITFNLNDTLLAYTGADSVLTMRVHIDTNSHSWIADTIVENNLPWTFLDSTFAETPGDSHNILFFRNASFTISNINGCDSIIAYSLYVHWNKTTDLYDTICENALPHTWQGAVFSRDSLQLTEAALNLCDTVIYPAAAGEDSLVVMHLYVKRNSSSTIYDTIVENSIPYTWNGVTFDSAFMSSQTSFTINGSLAKELQNTGIIANAAGCDSAANMNLLVWQNRRATADSSVCENFFDFSWNGVVFPDTALFQSDSVMLLTTHGADSLLTMRVTKLLNSYSQWSDTIVENQLAYTFNGTIFDHSLFGDTAALHLPPSSMTYNDSVVIIANQAGCDSLISYRLNVYWNVYSADNDTLCSAELPKQWNSRTFTQDIVASAPMEGRWRLATLYDTMPAWTGADSIIALRLHVMPSFSIPFYDTVCESQSFVWYGETLTVSGTYTQYFTTIDGCDSIEVLNFSNFPNYNLTYYDTICDYSGTMRLGVEYIGVAHLNTIHMCDSNETYHLWGMPVSYSTIDTIISDHQLPFEYNNQWFADSGISQAQFVLTNRYGCDSIINFTVTVMPTVRMAVDSSICDALLPLDWDGTVFSGDSTTYSSDLAAFVLIDTLHTRYGSDSIVTRRLHVSPSYNLTYYDTTCNGAPYHFGDSTYTVTGDYIHNYLTTIVDPIFGRQCDSIETLHLVVNAMSYATVSDTIVENQLPWTFGGVTFTTTDRIVDSTIIILNTVACDSVITYSLLVYPNTYVDFDTTVCDNELPFTWNGLTISHAGLDSIVVLLPDGTDSVSRLMTFVNPTYNTTDTVRVCDSYEWIDGNTYTESTRVNDYHLSSVHACDSVKNLMLTIDLSVTHHDSITSCDPYLWIDGETYSVSISGPSFLMQTIHQCDSTVILEFTKVEHKVTELFDTICKGVSYQFGGNLYTSTGSYSDSLMTEASCDSVVILNLHVLEPPFAEIRCEHDCETRIYTLTAQTDAPWFEWSSFPENPALTGHTHDRTIRVKPTTHERYLLWVDYKDVPTCPNDVDTNISPLLMPHAVIEYTPEFLTLDQLHLSLINRSTNEETHRWTINGDDYGDATRVSYFAKPDDDDSVVVELAAHHGVCHDSAMVVIPFRKATIWAPNVFTPGESNNNRFFVRYMGITDYRIDLYTREGALVWHSEDMNEGWDGTYKGKPMPQASYVWIIHYRDVTAPKNLLSKKGTVTLLR
ncbi:MAG: gliding motility-associated C-terminal domain-containing protein [Bacteroidales bacterium]|nr:gliding motility-associated C-terminal domain-containing protein [Bacteroidales bacterium]